MELIGALGVIFGCGGIGLILAQKVKKRPEELRSCSTALGLLDTEIYWGATPLPEAFIVLGERVDEPWKGFFKALAQHLLNGESAGTAWNDVIEKQQHRFSLKPEDWLVIKDVGKAIGRSDRREQHKHLERVQKQLSQIKEEAGEWAVKQSKLWSYMGFLLGIAAVIFLV